MEYTVLSVEGLNKNFVTLSCIKLKLRVITMLLNKSYNIKHLHLRRDLHVRKATCDF